MTYDERRESQFEPPDPTSWALRKRSWVLYRERGKFRERRGVRVPDTAILGTLGRMARLGTTGSAFSLRHFPWTSPSAER